MIVKKIDVITDNISLIRGFVPAILVGDDSALLLKRVGDRVTVVPDGQETREVTIVFRLNAAIAVSKGADLNEITGLLNVAFNGSIGALGTGLGAGSLAAGVGIAGATVQTLTNIRKKKDSSGSINIQIQMIDIGGTEDKGITTKISTSITGHTKTSDHDLIGPEGEIANISQQAKLLAANGSIVESKNEGTQRTLRIKRDESIATTVVNSGSVLGIQRIEWQLSTNGAWTNDTVSMVQISTLTLICEVAPPEAGSGGDPGSGLDGGSGVDDGSGGDDDLDEDDDSGGDDGSFPDALEGMTPF